MVIPSTSKNTVQEPLARDPVEEAHCPGRMTRSRYPHEVNMGNEGMFERLRMVRVIAMLAGCIGAKMVESSSMAFRFDVCDKVTHRIYDLEGEFMVKQTRVVP